MHRNRPLIAFFDYPDVFEDFYPHYGVDQRNFATRWAATGNHAFLSVLQRDVGDVLWYSFSISPELDEARHEQVGCRVKMLRSSWIHRCLWRMFWLPKCAWRWRWAYPVYATIASYLSLASSPFIRSILRDRPDFFFVQDYATGRFDLLVVLARSLGVPLVAYHSGSRPESYVGRLTKHWTIPHADCLIASGQAESNMLASRYRVPRQRLKVILTPIDTTVFRPLDRETACRRAGLDPKQRYILFVGRLDDAVKRVSALIRAFARAATQYPDAELVVAGAGPDGEKMRAAAEAVAPGRVRFLGWVAQPDALAALYNTAECLVLPSWREGFPTVVGEAAACGTPVIASRVGGVSELVVPGRTGWLLAPGDDEALAGVLSFVLKHPQSAAGMRRQVRLMAEDRVSPAAVARALQECFVARRGKQMSGNSSYS